MTDANGNEVSETRIFYDFNSASSFALLKGAEGEKVIVNVFNHPKVETYQYMHGEKRLVKIIY